MMLRSTSAPLFSVDFPFLYFVARELFVTHGDEVGTIVKREEMMLPKYALVIPLILCYVAFPSLSSAGKKSASELEWVGTWACSPQLVEPANRPPSPGLAGNTLRQIIHVSIGSDRLRVRFSNEFGVTPLALTSVHLALPVADGSINPETDKGLTFSGQPSVSIPAGAMMISDPIDFNVAPETDLAITLQAGKVPDGITGHPGSRATSYLVIGDAVSAPTLTNPIKADHWYVLDGVDVAAKKPAAAVVIAGDSITDGRGSNTNGNDRWPDDLARRLLAAKSTADVAILNHGIGGNRILHDRAGPNLLARFDRDVLVQPGVRWVIVLEGVNDIGTARKEATSGEQLTTAADLIAAFQQLIVRAHTHGLQIYGATILPFGGSFYFSPPNEADRQTVNTWIRTSGAFDAVIDFDKTTRDSKNPDRLRSDYDSGDHLHPSVAGYHAMADAIPLSSFKHK
jgi:lysophospholipase L1-like esterase